MTYSPIEHLQSLRIGTVEFVSPSEIKALLDIESPEAIALNAGVPRPFPKINNYVLVPNDQGFLVGQIEWLSVERSPFPKRRGMQDFGLVDLPYPLRKLSINPLGTLRKSDLNKYKFQRGVEAFPSIGDGVFLPTDQQLRSIIESGVTQRVKIGTSPLANGANVWIDPDRLFGRHLAVLGNTGSGKSCSVAGLIRWSLEKAISNVEGMNDALHTPNAHFILLDPNGEYTKAFSNLNESQIKSRVFKVDAQDKTDEMPLLIPLWFWNSEEWSSFTQASAKMQRPLLRRALREIRSGIDVLNPSLEEKILHLRRYLSSIFVSIKHRMDNGEIRNEASKFGYFLKATENDLRMKASLSEYNLYRNAINSIRQGMTNALSSTYKSFTKDGQQIEYYVAFAESLIDPISNEIGILLANLGGIIYHEGPSEDTPRPFRGVDFADHLQNVAEQENANQYVDFLVTRIRTLLADTRMKSIIDDGSDITLTSWLDSYFGIGADGNRSHCISIIDLSLVPIEIIHITVAVIARMVFESLQRYRKIHHHSLPTVLVMEEAHTFIKRYNSDAENYDASSVCCQVFEKIAREGRKFGLGLVLSSQRPSELSPTVLSQCNSFLLHRINNDRDQDLIHRLIPDNLRTLLRELPSLPSQNAVLLGWASELPVLVRMNDLPEHYQPQSDDPDFWNVWTNKSVRPVDWKQVANDWQR